MRFSVLAASAALSVFLATAAGAQPAHVVDNSLFGPYGGRATSTPNIVTHRTVVPNHNYYNQGSYYQQPGYQEQGYYQGGYYDRRDSRYASAPGDAQWHTREGGVVVRQASSMPLPDRPKPRSGARWACMQTSGGYWDRCDWYYTNRDRSGWFGLATGLALIAGMAMAY